MTFNSWVSVVKFVEVHLSSANNSMHHPQEESPQHSIDSMHSHSHPSKGHSTDTDTDTELELQPNIFHNV